jgi:hypothetical protein
MTPSTCSACGRELVPSDAFCPSCGASAGTQDSQQPEVVPPAAPAAPAEPASSPIPTVRRKNAVLGWFVVGTFAVTGIAGFIDPMQPVVGTIGVGFAVALAITRFARDRFSPGLLIGAAVAAFLMTLVGCGDLGQSMANAEKYGTAPSGGSGYLSFFVPGVLALIAGVRGRGDR